MRVGLIQSKHHTHPFATRSWQGVGDATLCYKVCNLLVAGRLFSQSTTVSSINKTDRHEYNRHDHHDHHHLIE